MFNCVWASQRAAVRGVNIYHYLLSATNTVQSLQTVLQCLHQPPVSQLFNDQNIAGDNFHLTVPTQTVAQPHTQLGKASKKKNQRKVERCKMASVPFRYRVNIETVYTASAFQSRKRLYNHKCMFIHPSVSPSVCRTPQQLETIILHPSSCFQYFFDTLLFSLLMLCQRKGMMQTLQSGNNKIYKFVKLSLMFVL